MVIITPARIMSSSKLVYIYLCYPPEKKMADTTDNVVFEVYGNTAEFATDYGTSGTGFTTAHVQLVKLAFGDENTTGRVYGGNPLPVQINGNTGSAVGISGEVSGTGSFEIENYYIRGASGNTLVYLAVAGDTLGGLVGVSGTVQGISGGYPVTVTGDISVTNNVAIVGVTGSSMYQEFGGTGYWPVVVTGGRKLNSSTDSVTVSGTVGVTGGRYLAAGTDSIAVLGADLGDQVLTRIYGSAGETLGVSGDALNVNLVNAGVTFTLNVAATIGVTNSTEPPLRVQGYTGGTGTPLTIRGENDGAVEVAATSPLNVTVTNSELTIDDTDILVKLGTTGDIYNRLSDIRTNTSSISTIRTDLQNGSATVKISQITRSNSMVVGSKTVAVADGASQMTSSFILKSGITIKASVDNTSTIYVGNQTLSRSTTNGYPLNSGESIFLEIGNANMVYVRSESGTQSVNYIGS